MNDIWILIYLVVELSGTAENPKVTYTPEQIETPSYEICISTKEDLGSVLFDDGWGGNYHYFQGLVCHKKPDEELIDATN